MTNYPPNPDYELDNVQRMHPAEAARIMQAQDQMIQSLEAHVKAQEEFIKSREASIQDLKLRLDKLEAIAKHSRLTSWTESLN